MGRPKRADEGGLIHYVLNRANARMTIFEKDGDYEAFELVLEEAVDRTQTTLLAYCVMPNHWQLIVWPHQDGEVSRFVGWLTLTHTQWWRAHRHTRGSGHVYQGRFKSFPVQGDEHFLTACRYVERNALRANLVERAEAWRWCSLAMVQPGPSKAVDSRGGITAVRLAFGASQELGGAGKRRADGGRVVGPSSLGSPWLAVRGGVVVGSDGAAPRPRGDASPPGAAQEATQRFLTPFPRPMKKEICLCHK